MTFNGLIINGRFLTRPITGVERYARELVCALDRELNAHALNLGEVSIVAPAGTVCDLDLKVIKFSTCGRRAKGHIWEQASLAYHARQCALLSLCNSGPVLHPRHLVVIHDAAVDRCARDYSFSYLALHRALGFALAKTATIATVSRFSQRELSELYGLEIEKIPIIPSASDHWSKLASDPSAYDSLALDKTQYFVVVGNASARKNVRLAVEALRLIARDDFRLVIVGGGNKKIFGNMPAAMDKRIMRAGHVSDEEMRYLYERALGLIFPTKYEGFGLPPLEAYLSGCPVFASSIEVVQEICGNAPMYFHPDDTRELAHLMMSCLDGQIDKVRSVSCGRERAAQYTWAKSVQALIQLLNDPLTLPQQGTILSSD